MFIHGGPGTGKTYNVKQTLAEGGLQKGQDWFLVKGKITTAELYKNLFMHRNDKIIVFDDTDSVWGNEEAANILKAALDTDDERLMSWYSNRTENLSLYSDEAKEEYYRKLDLQLRGVEPEPEYDDAGKEKKQKILKYPSEFLYDGKIIFISNLTSEQFDSAVLSRSARIDMTLTPNQMFTRIKAILPKIGNPEVPLNRKAQILEYLIDQYGKGVFSAPNMRTFVKAENVAASNLPNWREIVPYVA